MPYALSDEDNGPVEAPEMAGTERPLVDEMGGGAELTITADIELNIVGVVSVGPIKM